MDRRDFLKAFSAALASGGVMPAVARTERPSWPPPVDDPEDPLTDGEPVLLAPDATSMGVVWAVGTDRFHLNVQGRYLQALVWTKALFGVDPENCPYEPDFPWLPYDEFKSFAARAKVIRRAANA